MGRERNDRLVDVFGLTGWSKGELARLVNRRAAAMGCPQLATDTSRVRRWLEDGERPREPVPRVLAALFTERLGRVVTSEELGLEERASTRAQFPQEDLPWSTGHCLAALTEYTGMDLMLNRRGFAGGGFAMTTGPALVANLAQWMRPVRFGTDPAPAEGPVHWAGPFGAARRRNGSTDEDSEAEDSVPEEGGNDGGVVGTDEVAALEQAVGVFRAWDAERGGGLQRKAVVGQLNEVGNLLTHTPPGPCATRLWAVASALAALAGWMSHDVGLDPTAQNYFVIAAHAAREAGDLPRAAEALSRAARQMVHLGRPADGLALIELAQRTGGATAGPRTRAMFHTVRAWAQAATGEAVGARRSLALADQEFARAAADTADPDWIAYFDEADLHGMQALVHRTLAEPGEHGGPDRTAAAAARKHARSALDLRGPGRRRAHTFDLISLAAACLLDEQPEAGLAAARQALISTEEISSHRTWDRLDDLRRTAERFPDVPGMVEVCAEIEEGMPARRAGSA